MGSHDVRSTIRAAIVDYDQLVRGRERIKRILNLLDQGLDVFRFVQSGHNQGKSFVSFASHTRLVPKSKEI